MSIDSLPNDVPLSRIPGMLDREEPRDVSDDVFMLELTGEQIEYVSKALPFYRFHADHMNSGETLTIQDRQAIRAIETELERVVSQ